MSELLSIGPYVCRICWLLYICQKQPSTHTSWDWLCHGMQDRQTNKQHFSTHTRAHMLLFNMIVVPRNMEDYTECRISGRMHDGIRTCDAATAVLCIVRIGVSGPYTLTNIEETVSREFGPPFCEIFRKLWCLHSQQLHPCGQWIVLCLKFKIKIKIKVTQQFNFNIVLK